MAYRWFLGLDLDDRIPDHSTISQNRRRRFHGENLFFRLFEHILHLCIEKGLVDGKVILTDSTHVKASASFNSTANSWTGMKPWSVSGRRHPAPLSRSVQGA